VLLVYPTRRSGRARFLLRFIPYVGALASAVLPTLGAFAIFPGWSRYSFEVLGSFVFLDQAAAQLVEAHSDRR